MLRPEAPYTLAVKSEAEIIEQKNTESDLNFIFFTFLKPFIRIELSAERAIDDIIIINFIWKYGN